MSTFNNREIATGIWLFVFLAWALCKRNVRESLYQMLTAFFQPKILAWVGAMIAYTVCMVIGLSAIDVWTVRLLKDTVLWFVFTGFPLVFHFVTTEPTEPILPKILADNLRGIVIVQFLVNTYTFSLVWELLLIPFATVIAMMDALATTDKQYSSVSRVTSFLQSMTGIVILISALSKAAANYAELLSLGGLRSLLLAPALSVLFSPLIYLFLLIFSYELLFARLGMVADETRKRRAKRRILAHCRLSVSKVRECLRQPVVLRTICSKGER